MKKNCKVTDKPCYGERKKIDDKPCFQEKHTRWRPKHKSSSQHK